MAQIFQINHKIISQDGIEYTVQKCLGFDHFGEIYLVSSGEKDWALKWSFSYTGTKEQQTAIEKLIAVHLPINSYGR
jgi:hypothetical protein